jgi:hypothetical protein
VRLVLVASSFVAAVGLTACLGAPCGLLGERCGPDTGEGEGEDEGGGTFCQVADTQLGLVEAACLFDLSQCTDGTNYAIECVTENDCECQESTSGGQLLTSNFSIQASCTDFSTSSDLGRFVAFANENCGWDLTSTPEF